MEENFRKLASICLIEDIKEMENCDNICLVIIKGWQVVARKNIYNVGDKCVYVEIDSILPVDNPEFTDFEGKPIKTRKIRGQISQGIVFPLDILPEEIDNIKRLDLPINTNVTKILNILKYDPESRTEKVVLMNGKETVLKQWPEEIPKTDEERIQNIFTSIKNEYPTSEFIETEKLDGTSFTCYLNIENSKFKACSRNYLIDENHELYETAIKNNVDNILLKIKNTYNFNPMLQGECIGPKVQNNSYKLPDKNIYFFRLYNLDTKLFVDFEDFINIAKQLNITIVPIVNYNYKLPNTIKELLQHVNGKSLLCKSTSREGSVFIMKNSKNCLNNRLSFKVISNSFLLKQKY